MKRRSGSEASELECSLKSVFRPERARCRWHQQQVKVCSIRQTILSFLAHTVLHKCPAGQEMMSDCFWYCSGQLLFAVGLKDQTVQNRQDEGRVKAKRLFNTRGDNNGEWGQICSGIRSKQDRSMRRLISLVSLAVSRPWWG